MNNNTNQNSDFIDDINDFKNSASDAAVATTEMAQKKMREILQESALSLKNMMKDNSPSVRKGDGAYNSENYGRKDSRAESQAGKMGVSEMNFAKNDLNELEVLPGITWQEYSKTSHSSAYQQQSMETLQAFTEQVKKNNGLKDESKRVNKQFSDNDAIKKDLNDGFLQEILNNLGNIPK